MVLLLSDTLLKLFHSVGPDKGEMQQVRNESGGQRLVADVTCNGQMSNLVHQCPLFTLKVDFRKDYSVDPPLPADSYNKHQ